MVRLDGAEATSARDQLRARFHGWLLAKIWNGVEDVFEVQLCEKKV